MLLVFDKWQGVVGAESSADMSGSMGSWLKDANGEVMEEQVLVRRWRGCLCLRALLGEGGSQAE
jgi:hypothetical protein